MNIFNDKGRRVTCPYIHPPDRHGIDKYGGKWKKKGEPVEVDSTYCRRCYYHGGITKCGKNGGRRELNCKMENK